MIHATLIHPQILEALGRAGHGSKVLIADGNYPFSTTLGPHATLVSLNLSPGLVTCTQVLEALVTAIPVEAAAVMRYATEGPYRLDADPPLWADYQRILRGAGTDLTFDQIERQTFYQVAGAADVALTVATAEQGVYANLLLTIGVIPPPATSAAS